MHVSKRPYGDKVRMQLFARQEDGRKVILPVWHNISKDEVKRNSPILADMLAFRTADYTVDELVTEFMKFIRDDE